MCEFLAQGNYADILILKAVYNACHSYKSNQHYVSPSLLEELSGRVGGDGRGSNIETIWKMWHMRSCQFFVNGPFSCQTGRSGSRSDVFAFSDDEMRFFHLES